MNHAALSAIVFLCMALGSSGSAALDAPKLPSAGESIKEFMQKEELPVNAAAAEPEKKASMGLFKGAIAIAFLLLAAGATVVGVKALRTQSQREGSRKYLIEKVSYTNLGPKTGVCLLKVGQEFVLVGVTSQQVSFLSTLPRLQKQYEEESKFETDSFKEAVQEEFQRIKGKSSLNI